MGQTSRNFKLYARFLLGIVFLVCVVVHAAKDIKLPSSYIPVPVVRQETEYSCGAATTLALLRYWQVFDGKEKDLYEDLGTHPDDGTDPRAMVKVLKDYGLKARYQEDTSIEDLRTALAAGKTLILDLQAWRTDTDTAWKDQWEDGHYVIAVAIDKHRLYVMDPSTPKTYAYVPLSELIDRWHDYELKNDVLWRNFQLAIYVEGKTPDKSFRAPRRVSRMD